ncbi:dnaJ ERDJ2A [Micractinium conductrix]|uniref:DnaJ ERDJ2A n=1 Tax=Micractinium conductrix TaxID=554055 RepID=A0A2P6UYY1_9CHLO|nr:dnaJ ERDJ2A [Micractinium conductrix]|eukprot:PSC67052.1 dnaJ ERDJ2A [Micractinium conductrix]
MHIRQVPLDATEAEIKRAYRKLSLVYHPDKNPDPKAHNYFATYIAKAYKALTDETSRENYLKYGHPDGPQAMTVSVALPEWFFSKDKQTAPLILLVLLFGGIVTPLGMAAWYLMGTQKFVGPNQLMEETLLLFMDPRYGIKASQALGRLPETLVCAMEFISLPTPSDQGPAMDELRKTVLRLHPDLKDKSAFWKRRTSVLKVHMLLLAHLSREEIPAVLQKDLEFLLTKGQPLVREMLGLSTAPRIQPGYGWLTPTVGCIELMQCMVQAVPLESKKAAHVGKSAESPAALLQLPHFDKETLRRLTRKKVKALPELQQMGGDERAKVLKECGLSASEVEDVETMLSAMPTVWVSAQCVVEAEELDDEVVLTGDIVTCRIQVMLTRPSHMAASFDPDSIKGKAALAYAPRFPAPKEESWYFLVADPATNAALAITKQNLLQAEAIGARYAANWSAKHNTPAVAAVGSNGSAPGGGKSGGGKGEAPPNPLLAGTKLDPFAANGSAEALDSSIEELGQTFELKFYAPLAPAKYDLQLLCMPDSWVGCDRAVPIKLRVDGATRADREGRGRRAALQRTEESEALMAGGDGSNVDSDAGHEDEEGEDYESEEYGTEESGDEGSDGEASDDD